MLCPFILPLNHPSPWKPNVQPHGLTKYCSLIICRRVRSKRALHTHTHMQKRRPRRRKRKRLDDQEENIQQRPPRELTTMSALFVINSKLTDRASWSAGLIITSNPIPYMEVDRFIFLCLRISSRFPLFSFCASFWYETNGLLGPSTKETLIQQLDLSANKMCAPVVDSKPFDTTDSLFNFDFKFIKYLFSFIYF